MENSKKSEALWRILVPTKYEDSQKPVSIRHHKQFDKYVLTIVNGLTILPPTIKGIWKSDGKEYIDRTIPVDIYCSEKQITKIARFAKSHYRQLSIMYFKITDQVFFI